MFQKRLGIVHQDSVAVSEGRPVEKQTKLLMKWKMQVVIEADIASTDDIEIEALDKVEQANQSTDEANKKVSEVDTSAEAVEACIADKFLAEKRVKELEKEA
jgi:hypothetical protein